VRLACGDVVDVGAHSETHALLPALPAEEQWREISGSRTTLERILGKPVRAFAFPFGQYSRETVRLVKEAGFAYACTGQRAAVWRRSQTMALPRVMVHDCDGEALERVLRAVVGSCEGRR